MTARILRRLWLTGVTAAALTLAGCTLGPTDGKDLARDIAASAAKELNTKLGYRQRIRDAEHIAASEIRTDPQGTGEVNATPLGWSGRVFGDEKATIEVRFTATVLEEYASSVGGSGNTAGSATRCYRYTLQLYRYTDYAEIRCPAIATPPVPTASPVLILPADAQDRLAAALRRATPRTLASTVRAAFPQPGIGVDTVTYRGTMVAAVGVAPERDCIVMIRTPDGATKLVRFDRIQLEPGESGCRTSLYTHPPQ